MTDGIPLLHPPPRPQQPVAPTAQLDGFCAALTRILKEAKQDPERVKGAPYTTPVRRLDDVRAARELDLTWKPDTP